MTDRFVLLADTNPEMHRLIDAALATQRFRTITAAQGEDAFTIARTVRPELIVTDLDVGDQDGFAIVGRLKSDPITAGIPVLAVTDDPYPELQQRVRSAGFDALLIKPVTATTLGDVGRLLVERAALLHERAVGLRQRGAAARERAADAQRSADATQVAALTAGDEDSAAPTPRPRCRKCGSDDDSRVVRTTRSSVTYRCGVCHSQWRLTFKKQSGVTETGEA